MRGPRKTQSQKALELRRNMILEMIMAEPTRRWSYAEISEEARKLPWFQQHMPTYSTQTAYRDYLAVKNETKENREKLAESILVKQLDETDNQIQGILEDIETLGALDEFLASNPDLGIADIAQFAKAKNTYLNALGRLMDKQASLVPIEVPKQVTIDNNFTVDHYLQARKEYEKLDSPKIMISDGIEDGEFEEE